MQTSQVGSEAARAPNRISVALCTFNGSRYLREQLDSILRQTRPPDELVVCDDRSVDDTVGIVETYAARAPFTVRLYRNESTLGPNQNFAQAIRKSTGDVIALSDQDNVWYPKKLQYFEDAFSASPEVGIVLADSELVNEDLSSCGRTLWQFLGFRNLGRAKKSGAVAALLKRNPAFGHTMAFRARFGELILPLPANVAYDMWIGMIVGLSAELAFIDEPLVKYRQHEEQLTKDTKAPGTFSQRLADARRDRHEALNKNRPLFERAYDRLQTRGGDMTARGMQLLKAKIDHLQTRAQLPDAKLKRLLVAARELATLRYHRYSNGVPSFARDLLL